MKHVRFISAAVSLLAIGAIAWFYLRGGDSWRHAAPSPAAGADNRPANALHLGLVPERDIYAQRKRFRAMADYLSSKLGRPVELVTCKDYKTVLDDFADGTVDAAFLGSLITVMAVDRLDAKILMRPVMPDGVSTYRGVIFVRQDSPIQSVDQLAGRSLAMVRGTTGGNLFPLWEMVRRGWMKSGQAPRMIWAGTHDNGVNAVFEREADAGAVKDLRLNEIEKEKGYVFRRLAASEPVPENSLVVRAAAAAEWGDKLKDVLGGMERDPQAKQTLETFGAVRFIPTCIDDYAVIYRLIEEIGPAWDLLGISGPPPVRRRNAASGPASAPASRPGVGAAPVSP